MLAPPSPRTAPAPPPTASRDHPRGRSGQGMASNVVDQLTPIRREGKLVEGQKQGLNPVLGDRDHGGASMPTRRLTCGDRTNRRDRGRREWLFLVEGRQPACPHCRIPLPVGDKQRQLSERAQSHRGAGNGTKMLVPVPLAARTRRHTTWERGEALRMTADPGAMHAVHVAAVPRPPRARRTATRRPQSPGPRISPAGPARAAAR